MPNDDYIKRSDALEHFGNYLPGYSILYDDVIRGVEELPAADVEPKRKTGYWFDLHASQWVQYGAVQYKCSECGKDVMRKTKYCEECGAKMDAEPPKEEEDDISRN